MNFLSYFLTKLGLRTQTTNGLVRCRTVGLSLPTKDTSKKNNNVAPSFKHQSYQGRNKAV